jgi:hypothetical protein
MSSMKAWTKKAEQRMEEYLDARAEREGFSGSEAEEFKSDLRCHILEEAARDSADMINVGALERLLGRLDAGYQPPSPPARSSARFKGLLMWIFGVVLPLGIIAFEWLANFCGSVFFDPIPTFWHGVALLLVPLSNAWILRGGPSLRAGLVGGVGLVISLFYALLFAPLVPLSVIALMYLGMGVLSLTPVFAGLATWRITRRTALDSPGFRQGRRWGIGLGTLALVLVGGLPLWTRVNLEMATQQAGASAALTRLRAFHSERALLSACYEGNRRVITTDISGWLLRGWRVTPMFLNEGEFVTNAEAERRREVYFRVTGKSVDTVEPPRSARKAQNRRGRDDWDQIEFDADTGGDKVALRLKGLSLADSRFDGHLDSTSQLGYGEWTMVFSNSSPQQKEARCQVRLPQGGRVSRLTLWVNGEPQEAAFSTVSKVKAAYKQVVVVERRDPVLVTMCGPDTVMVQCFPVPGHGEMKIRFGITAPLTEGRWTLPYILERNFGWKDGLNHSVWLQGDKGFELRSPSKSPRSSCQDGPGQSLGIDLAATNDASFHVVEMAGLQTPPATVWSSDPFAKDEEKFLIREAKIQAALSGVPPVIVIDGSASMASTQSWLPELLQNGAHEHTTILLADDTARKISPEALRDYDFSGGRNNEPALREAVRIAKERPGTSIVWLHGPQAVKLAQPEALLQLLERGTVRPTIHSLEVTPGPNRLGEAVYATGVMVLGPALCDPKKDFGVFLTSLQNPVAFRWEWSRSSTSSGLPGKEVWDHLAREWAAREADGGGPAELGARYQLVTQRSGAVVLENMSQYVAAGLEPGDPNASPQIPTIPEPSALILIMTAAACGLLRRHRSQQ